MTEKFYPGILTWPELFWRIALVPSAFYVFPLLLDSDQCSWSYKLCSASALLITIAFCLGWNDQLELSRDGGLVFLRKVFFWESQKVWAQPEELESIVVQKSRKLVQVVQWGFKYITYRELYQVTVRCKNGKSYPLGSSFPHSGDWTPDKFAAARGQAETAARNAANKIGLPFQSAVGG